MIINDLYTFRKLPNERKRAHQWNCYIKKSQSFYFNMDSTGDSTNIKTIISLTPTVKICMSIDSQALLLWGLRNGVCVCVCVCTHAHVNNILNKFLQKKKSDEVRSRDPIIGSWLIIVLTCVEWPEFHTDIRYMTIRNFDTSLCSTNFTIISFIFWKQIFKCTDHIYRY